jgi:MFS transporter, FHS family, glucose/mannose:H+ symporter
VSTQPTSPAARTQVELTGPAFANLSGIFILTGATAALFGPLLVTFSHHFGVSLAQAGVVLSVFFIGGFVGVLPGWLGYRHTSGRLVLVVSLTAVAVGTLLSGLVHSWLIFLIGIAIVGLGFGALDMGLNVLLSRTRDEGRAHRLSIVNAGFGVGSVISPLILVAVHPRNFPMVLVGLGVAAIALMPLTRGVHAPAFRREELQTRIKTSPQRRPILITFIAAYATYVAAESSATGWMSSQLQRGGGYSATVGSVVTTLFWVAMTIGRSSGGLLHRRWSEQQLILGGLALALPCDLLAISNHLALVTYPLLGFLLASVFPMGLLWYSRLLPHDSDGVSAIMFAMMAGGIIGPGLVSLLVAHLGVGVIPLVFAGLASVNLAIFASARRFTPVTFD